MEIRDRLHALREAMAEREIDAYVIPSSDPHQSEYPPEHWRSRAWISGFDGSAGTVVVTADRAGLWTDFRYYLHAEKALAGTGIELFRSGEQGVPEYPEWLAAELQQGNRVGFDGMCVSLSAARALISAFCDNGITCPGCQSTSMTRDTPEPAGARNSPPSARECRKPGWITM